MLHLKFALNLESLADNMIDFIFGKNETDPSRIWKDPFLSPIIIFPDPKLEQWFRLRCLKRKGTIAGLSTMRIDKFLTTILIGDDPTKKKLRSETLLHVILGYLYKNKNNLHALDPSGEIERYLYKDSTLSETNLYDFASTMASLFLEYETSRPGNFIQNERIKAQGILDCWKEGALKDFFDKSPREKWQRALYSKIFHKQGTEISLLSKVFLEASKERLKSNPNEQIVEYLTIPYLFESAKKKGYCLNSFTDENGNVLPVFLFGLSGMGQFYRVILEDFSKKYDVYAYLQNPCMEFWEDINTQKNYQRSWVSKNKQWSACDNEKLKGVKEKLSLLQTNATLNTNHFETFENENTLLCRLGKSGRDNIKLWCSASDYDFEFAENTESFIEDSLLHCVQKTIAERKNESKMLFFKYKENALNNDPSFSVTASPTRVREMEILHSRICKLLQKENKLSDILVVSPCLDEYRTAIYQAFDQNAGDESLKIPFSIVDSNEKVSLTGNALETLFSMQEKSSITRPDFFRLLRNQVVQSARQISSEDVNVFESWIENMNVFRDREESKENWFDAVRKLLLSKFTNSVVNFSADNDSLLLPYSDIDSTNDVIVSKFADSIESLNRWIQSKNTPPDLTNVQNFIVEWLSMDTPSDELYGETIILENVLSSFEDLRYELYAGLEHVSWKSLQQTLINAAQSSKYSCASMFINGVTFMNFAPNRIIPVKHLFFIGANANVFPGKQSVNSMDLRKNAPWPGDDSLTDKMRYAFLCQLMSSKESFHLSYLAKNLVKDEELYATTVINDIRNFFKNSIRAFAKKEHIHISKAAWQDIKIDLDETRPYEDLFSERSLRNKELYQSMMRPQKKTNKISLKLETTPLKFTKTNTDALPDRVSVHQLQMFLEDPFIFRISQMMQMSNSFNSEENPEDIIFEPIDFTALEFSKLIKERLSAKLSTKEETSLDLEKTLNAKNTWPDSIFKAKLDLMAAKKIEHVLKQMNDDSTTYSPAKDSLHWSFRKKLDDITLESHGKKWVLTGTLDWFYQNDKELCLATVVSSNPQKPSKILSSYLNALALIAKIQKDDSITIPIHLYCLDTEKKTSLKNKVVCTPSKAKKILNKIYSLAFKERYSKAVPIDLLNEEMNFKLLIDSLENSDSWKFFEKKYLFDKEQYLGYSEQTFDSDWKNAVQQQESLLEALDRTLNEKRTKSI